MLSVGFSEIILILIVGCLVIDHKSIPSLLRDIGTYYRKFLEVREEVLKSLNEVCCKEVIDPRNLGSQKKHVVGDDGVLYEAYDVGDAMLHTAHVEALDNQESKHNSERDSTGSSSTT